MAPSKVNKNVLKKSKKLSKSKRSENERNYLKGQIPLLKTLKELTPEQCQALIPYISPKSHDALCTCIRNALINYNKFTPDEISSLKNVLSPKIDNYRYLSNERKNRSNKKKRASVLQQSGEGLPAILATVIPLLANLLFPV
jgi:hypothetical protein